MARKEEALRYTHMKMKFRWKADKKNNLAPTIAILLYGVWFKATVICCQKGNYDIK